MGPKYVLERASGSISIKIWSERAPRGLRSREKIVREGLRSEKKESKRDLNELFEPRLAELKPQGGASVA